MNTLIIIIKNNYIKANIENKHGSSTEEHNGLAEKILEIDKHI